MTSHVWNDYVSAKYNPWDKKLIEVQQPDNNNYNYKDWERVLVIPIRCIEDLEEKLRADYRQLEMFEDDK